MASDNELFAAMVGGDQDAATMLINRYDRPMKTFLLRKVNRDHAAAEDIQQEAWIRAIQNHDKFDQEKCFKTWLYTIATRLCLSRHRVDARQNICLISQADDGDSSLSMDTVVDSSPWPDQIACLEESGPIHEMLTNAIERMDPDTRECMQRRMRGETYDQIGAACGHLHAWAIMRVRAGLEILRDEFQDFSGLSQHLVVA